MQPRPVSSVTVSRGKPRWHKGVGAVSAGRAPAPLAPLAASRSRASGARHNHVGMLDADAHPVGSDWQENRLDETHPLTGAIHCGPHAGNPRGYKAARCQVPY